ncbi:chromatin-remodeling protein 11 [Actinidia rufa]|uniref:Chromatin-remodeling protein 11 n=1 Tax=Actinidia rufa TaxID=165716 RepID=A0A7J0EFX8_9ERIC|nr:chromatin-remodeling protein 11 [Actinidia rufa]
MEVVQKLDREGATGKIVVLKKKTKLWKIVPSTIVLTIFMSSGPSLNFLLPEIFSSAETFDEWFQISGEMTSRRLFSNFTRKELFVCCAPLQLSFHLPSIDVMTVYAEAAIVSKIMSGKCSVKMLKELGHCLALLPKSRGDEDSWSLMMQKILLSINVHLNDTFQGVEEGKDPPLPLGVHSTGEASDQRIKRPERLQMSSVSTLMRCCCTMLTSPYPV